MNVKLRGKNMKAMCENLTLKRVRANIVVEGKQLVLRNVIVRICSLGFPACNAHASYCHLWSDTFSTLFVHIIS